MPNNRLVIGLCCPSFPPFNWRTTGKEAGGVHSTPFQKGLRPSWAPSKPLKSPVG